MKIPRSLLEKFRRKLDEANLLMLEAKLQQLENGVFIYMFDLSVLQKFICFSTSFGSKFLEIFVLYTCMCCEKFKMSISNLGEICLYSAKDNSFSFCSDQRTLQQRPTMLCAFLNGTFLRTR